MNTEDSRNLSKQLCCSIQWWQIQFRIASIPLFALGLALTSCSSSKAPNPKPLTTENLLGVYELVSYEGQPLPTGNGRATFYGGKIVLKQKQLYTQTVDVETCYPATPCERNTGNDGGTWLLLSDSTLYFDSSQSYGWPPLRVEADGQEIRFYIPDMNRLSFTYRRK